MTIIIFIIILAILVLSHEFGHFIVAKLLKMRVDEFGFGFPPKVASVKYGETTYSFNLIPFGGFVKIYGEDGGEGKKDRSFTSKSKLAQCAVLASGVIFNLLLAWVLFSIGFSVGFPTVLNEVNKGELENPRVFITNVIPKSPAQIAGIELGDVVNKISNRIDEITPLYYEDAVSFIENNTDNEISITYERGGELYTVYATPVSGIIEGKKAIGVSFDTIGILSISPTIAIWEGLKRTVYLTIETVKGFYSFIRGSIVGDAELSLISGPVGIYGIVNNANSLGLPYLIGITAIISISLAIVNLIPFPALDGGRILFLIIESIKGSPINKNITQTLNWIGFAALIILMIFVTYGDLLKIGII